jgi:purine-binding chemotaxis protein CheW
VSPTTSQAPTLVAVRLGVAEFGLPIERVREVLPPPPVTRIPFAAPEILGITSVRGTLLPVLDLGLRLLRDGAARPGLLVIIAPSESEGPVGLLVDEVSGLVEAAAEAIEEPPAEAIAALPPGFLLGVVAPEPGRLIAVLDLTRVLALQESSEEEP